MEQELKKRRRGNDEELLSNDSKQSAKKRELNGFDSDYDVDILKFPDSFQPLGVFDFPWLTEEKQPINEPEELKFEDVFSSSLLETSSETSLTEFSGDESCHRTPFLVVEKNNKLEDVFDDHSRDDEINGVDCIWSSVLNQPLFTGSGNT